MFDRSASKSGHVGAGPGQGQGSPRPKGPAPRSHRSTWCRVPGQPWLPDFLPKQVIPLAQTLAGKSRKDLLWSVANTSTGKGQFPAPIVV